MIETGNKNTTTGDTMTAPSKRQLQQELEQRESDAVILAEAQERLRKCSDSNYVDIQQHRVAIGKIQDSNSQRIGYVRQMLHPVELIPQASDYSYLKEVDRYKGGKEVAKNVRLILKKEFKGLRFSVKSDYDSVRIAWVGGVTQDAVEAHIGQFKSGHFDGMQDMYVNNDDACNMKYGSVKYVFYDRKFGTAEEQVKVLIEADGCAGREGMYEGARLARKALWETDLTNVGEVSGVHFDYDLQRYVVDFVPVEGDLL